MCAQLFSATLKNLLSQHCEAEKPKDAGRLATFQASYVFDEEKRRVRKRTREDEAAGSDGADSGGEACAIGWGLMGMGTILRTIKKEADLRNRGLSGRAVKEMAEVFGCNDSSFPDPSAGAAQKAEAAAILWRAIEAKLGARPAE